MPVRRSARAKDPVDYTSKSKASSPQWLKVTASNRNEGVKPSSKQKLDFASETTETDKENVDNVPEPEVGVVSNKQKKKNNTRKNAKPVSPSQAGVSGDGANTQHIAESRKGSRSRALQPKPPQIIVFSPAPAEQTIAHDDDENIEEEQKRPRESSARQEEDAAAKRSKKQKSQVTTAEEPEFVVGSNEADQANGYGQPPSSGSPESQETANNRRGSHLSRTEARGSKTQHQHPTTSGLAAAAAAAGLASPLCANVGAGSELVQAPVQAGHAEVRVRHLQGEYQKLQKKYEDLKKQQMDETEKLLDASSQSVLVHAEACDKLVTHMRGEMARMVEEDDALRAEVQQLRAGSTELRVENERLDMACKAAGLEKQELAARQAELQAQVADLQHRQLQGTQALDQLQTTYQQTASQKEQVEAREVELGGEMKKLQEEVEGLQAQVDEERGQTVMLSQELTALIEENAALKEGHEADLQALRQREQELLRKAAVGDRAARDLQEERVAKADLEIQAADRQRVVTTEVAAMNNLNEHLTAELDSLRAQDQDKAAQIAALTTQLAQMTADSAKLADELSQLRMEKEQVHMEKEQVQMEKEQARVEMEQLAADYKHEKEQVVVELQQQNDELAAALQQEKAGREQDNIKREQENASALESLAMTHKVAAEELRSAHAAEKEQLQSKFNAAEGGRVKAQTELQVLKEVYITQLEKDIKQLRESHQQAGGEVAALSEMNERITMELLEARGQEASQTAECHRLCKALGELDGEVTALRNMNEPLVEEVSSLKSTVDHMTEKAAQQQAVSQEQTTLLEAAETICSEQQTKVAELQKELGEKMEELRQQEEERAQELMERLEEDRVFLDCAALEALFGLTWERMRTGVHMFSHAPTGFKFQLSSGGADSASEEDEDTTSASGRSGSEVTPNKTPRKTPGKQAHTSPFTTPAKRGGRPSEDESEEVEEEDANADVEVTYLPLDLGEAVHKVPAFLREQITFNKSQMPMFFSKVLPAVHQ